jgi:hypothetical protein
MPLRSAFADLYWYVKARNLKTGEEVQRLSSANGATEAPEAAIEMQRYLRQAGRVDGDWEITEVCRWPRLPAPPAAPPREALTWRMLARQRLAVIPSRTDRAMLGEPS